MSVKLLSTKHNIFVFLETRYIKGILRAKFQVSITFCSNFNLGRGYFLHYKSKVHKSSIKLKVNNNKKLPLNKKASFIVHEVKLSNYLVINLQFHLRVNLTQIIEQQ